MDENELDEFAEDIREQVMEKTEGYTVAEALEIVEAVLTLLQANANGLRADIKAQG